MQFVPSDIFACKQSRLRKKETLEEVIAQSLGPQKLSLGLHFFREDLDGFSMTTMG